MITTTSEGKEGFVSREVDEKGFILREGIYKPGLYDVGVGFKKRKIFGYYILVATSNGTDLKKTLLFSEENERPFVEVSREDFDYVIKDPHPLRLPTDSEKIAGILERIEDDNMIKTIEDLVENNGGY